jgi:endo-1,4-beta-xylanase
MPEDYGTQLDSLFTAVLKLSRMRYTVFFLAPLAVLAAPASDIDARQASVSIDALIKQRGKSYIGTCSDQNRLSTGSSAAVIKANFGQVTPENSMKWDQIHPSQNSYNWGQPDYLMNFATQNNVTVRGHTLVWHSQLAGWVNGINDKATLTQAIQSHISTIVGRYKGKIRAWVS